MSIHPNLQLLLHLIDRHAGCTGIDLVDHLKCFVPDHHPTTQQAVRSRLKCLMESGLVQLASRGKPRTYLRTRKSYRLVPAAWSPETQGFRRNPSPERKR